MIIRFEVKIHALLDSIKSGGIKHESNFLKVWLVARVGGHQVVQVNLPEIAEKRGHVYWVIDINVRKGLIAELLVHGELAGAPAKETQCH